MRLALASFFPKLSPREFEVERERQAFFYLTGSNETISVHYFELQFKACSLK